MKRILFFGLPIIMMFFGACSSGTDDSFWTYKSGMRVYRSDTMEEFTGDATLKKDIGGIPVDAGKIVNGKVYIEMPKTLDASYLTTWNMATTNPPTKSARVFDFDVVIDGKYIGPLRFSKDISVEGWDVEKELNQMSFHYYPNDCTVTGNSTVQWKSVTIHQEFNMIVKSGWNAIFSSGTYNKDVDPNNANRLWTSDISKAPTDMRWVIRFSE